MNIPLKEKLKMRMILAGFVLLLMLAAWGADKFQPLNVKTGLWETTTNLTRSGELPLPPEYLARLTPEQRARIEARMKANSATKTTTHTSKSCLTKEKLQQAPFSDQQKGCTHTLVTSTSSKAVVKFACDIEDSKMSGTVDVVALNAENVKGSSHITATGDGHTMNTSGTFTSKWLGPACGDVK